VAGRVIGVVIAALAALFGAAAAVGYWNGVREAITAWLHRHGLAKTALTKALIELDKVAVGIRRTIKVATAHRPVETVTVEELALDQITDPELLRQLEAGKTVRIDILHDL
jgi:hypothetical protein